MTTAGPGKTTLPVVPQGAGPGDAIDYELLMSCVHCGLCLGACPTYTQTGNENDSPRGRIYLWRAVIDGRAELSEEARHHLDLCLECRACETACPSGVQYGQIIGSYKKHVAATMKPLPMIGGLQRWMLLNITPSARRTRMALAPIRLLQWLRLDGVARWLSRLLPRSLRNMQDIVPTLERAPERLPEVLPPVGPRRARVALLTGCAADAFYPWTTYATAKVLQANGCEVWIPPGQVCCGALHYHSGMVAEARLHARQNCQAFSRGLADGLKDVDAIVNNAGGCGPVLKEYHHILGDGPGAELAAEFAGKVKDITEFLVELGPVPPKHPLRLKATYHDACGLSHAQKIRTQPRQLLAMIPELELVPLAEGEMCCGAAGSYNLTQPEMAHEVGKRKADHILNTGARAVFTGNVGCLLQISRHLRRERSDLWVGHTVDALWGAYSGELPRAARKVLG